MSQGFGIALFLLIAVIAANLPWLSERNAFVRAPRGGLKRPWVRVTEWLVLYFVVGGVGLGLERQLTGTVAAQDWEFYAVTLCLFAVFALPGFIYRFQLRRPPGGP